MNVRGDFEWRKLSACVLAVMFAFLAPLDAQTPPPILTLNVPFNGTEGGTLVGAGTVSVDGGTNHPPITVNLLSYDTNRVRVVPFVIISPGSSSAHFDLVLVDNDLIEDTEKVFIEALLDDDSGDLDVIRVNDNESRALAIALPLQVIEGQGTLTNAGMISFSGRPLTNVVIALQSDHPELVAVPPLVTNFAGQASVSFKLVIANNSLSNAFDFVRVSASAPGFIGTTGTVILLDDERPFAPTNRLPLDLATQVPHNTTLRWTIDSRAPPGTLYDVYFGTNPTPGAAEFLGSTVTNAWPLPLLAANTTYYWQIIGRKFGTMAGPVWRFTTRGVHHFELSEVASPQLAGEPFDFSVMARDELNRIVTNFNGVVNLSEQAIGAASNSILPSPAPGFSLAVGSGNEPPSRSYGYAFTPNTNLTVTAVRHYFDSGGAVSIWTDAGVLLTQQQVADVIGNHGTWGETPLPMPVVLQAGSRYRVACHPGAGVVYWRTDGASTFPHGTIDQGYHGLSSEESVFFPGTPDANRWTLVDLRYQAGLLLPAAIVPTNSSPFVNGVWTGLVTMSGETRNTLIEVADNAGHTGSSNPFQVFAAPISIVTQPASQTIETGMRVEFVVSALGIPPLHYQWRFKGGDLLDATNAVLILSEAQTNHSGDYDVVITNRFGSIVSSNAMLVVLPPFFDDFEPGIHFPQWSSFTLGLVLATNYGGSVSGVNSLWVGGAYIGGSDMPSRFAVSRSIDTRLGGKVDFHFRIASGSGFPWDKPELPDEGIVFECSTNAGANWVELGRYDTTNYFAWTHLVIDIPFAAQTTNTQFRGARLSYPARLLTTGRLMT